jgi:formylglycine-generating enzyme required for sulfatase activity
MIKHQSLFVLGALVLTTLMFFSCGKEQSPTTGWSYNDPKNGGFQVVPYEEQETGPGLVLIEGGTFVMGRTEQDVHFDWSNQPRRTTVPSFYMDMTEVRNLDYLEYLHWLNRVYRDENPRIIQKALPDTLVWRSKLAYNEPYVDYYFRHPAYRDYPVVGVNWLQARDYCSWRTDRVNEYILVEIGVLNYQETPTSDNHFNTEAYLVSSITGIGEESEEQLVDISPNGGGYRRARMEDGILLPKYRLPTEAEWEYAALGLIGNTMYERVVERRLYPWNGHITRTDAPGNYGDMVANFRRGRGDYMGVAGNLNDAASITAPVYAYWPNDYGLYNMGGNVSEWVMDVYRPLTFEDMDDYNSFRGNVYKTYVRDNTGAIADKLYNTIYDYEGILKWLQNDENTGFFNNLSYELNDDEEKLKADLLAGLEVIIQLNKDRKYEEAAETMTEMMEDKLYGNPSEYIEIAAEIQKGISDFIIAQPGELRTRDVTIEENLERRNYRKSNNINYLDGDYASNYNNTNDWSNWRDDDVSGTGKMYDYSQTSMINDNARVYKGGSWKDGAYWLSPGARRFLDERQSTDDIGFRCAMTRVGSPIGNY